MNITPEPRRVDAPLGVGWPGSKKVSEKTVRISALETELTGIKAELSEFKRQILEMGNNERQSAILIRDLRAILKTAERPVDNDAESKELASKGYVIENTNAAYDSCQQDIKQCNADISVLKADLTHKKASRDELRSLEQRSNEKIRHIQDLADVKIKGLIQGIAEQFGGFTKGLQAWLLRIERLEVKMGRIEADPHHWMEPFHKNQGNSDDEENSLVPYYSANTTTTTTRHFPEHYHRRLPIMPPPVEEVDSKLLNMSNWDFDSVRARLSQTLP